MRVLWETILVASAYSCIFFSLFLSRNIFGLLDSKRWTEGFAL